MLRSLVSTDSQLNDINQFFGKNAEFFFLIGQISTVFNHLLTIRSLPSTESLLTWAWSNSNLPFYFLLHFQPSAFPFLVALWKKTVNSVKTNFTWIHGVVMFSFFKGQNVLDHITRNLGNNKKQASVNKWGNYLTKTEKGSFKSARSPEGRLLGSLCLNPTGPKRFQCRDGRWLFLGLSTGKGYPCPS